MKMIRFCSLKLLALSIVLWMTSATMRADDKNIKKRIRTHQHGSSFFVHCS